MDDLKVGDVVELNSGGPKMTIEEIGDDTGGKPTVWCAWFAVNSGAFTHSFRAI